MNRASNESALASIMQCARFASRTPSLSRGCRAVALGSALICGQVMAATDLSSAIDLNQHGISGAWYDPASSGQGFVISVIPNVDGAGHSGYFGGWFTYENEGVTTTPAAPMWLTFQGTTADLAIDPQTGKYGPGFGIFENDGTLGRFNAPPVVPATLLGRAYIAMSDCNHMLLHYEVQRGNWIDPPWYDINLVRLLPNVGCVETSNPPFSSFPSYGDVFGFSGAWYDPATSGQGFAFEINPQTNGIFGGWFTYANDNAPQDQRGRRWYTLQGGTASITDVGSDSPVPTPIYFNHVGIFETTGGSFATPNLPGAVISTTQVGTAAVDFTTCTDASVSYAFTTGENAGRSGTINLKRLGGVPPECSDFVIF